MPAARRSRNDSLQHRPAVVIGFPLAQARSRPARPPRRHPASTRIFVVRDSSAAIRPSGSRSTSCRIDRDFRRAPDRTGFQLPNHIVERTFKEMWALGAGRVHVLVVMRCSVVDNLQMRWAYRAAMCCPTEKMAAADAWRGEKDRSGPELIVRLVQVKSANLGVVWQAVFGTPDRSGDGMEITGAMLAKALDKVYEGLQASRETGKNTGWTARWRQGCAHLWRNVFRSTSHERGSRHVLEYPPIWCAPHRIFSAEI